METDTISVASHDSIMSDLRQLESGSFHTFAEDDVKPVEEVPLAAKETKAVNWTKALLLGLLAVAAILCGIVTFRVTTSNNEKEFQTQFNNFGTEIVEEYIHASVDAFATVQTLSTALTSFAGYVNANFPFVTLPDFEVRGVENNKLSRAELILFAPLVDDSQRSSWGTYSEENQVWIAEGLNVSLGEVKPISPEIFRLEDEARVLDNNAGVALPIWQVAPTPRDTSIINFNLLSNPEFAEVFKKVLWKRQAVLSRIADLTFLTGGDKHTRLLAEDRSSNFLMAPVFKDFSKKSRLVGVLVAVIPWKSFFKDIQTGGGKGVRVVLVDSSGRSFTYEVGGHTLSYLGQGDMHDSEYDEIRITHPLVVQAGSTNATSDSCSEGCLHVYASSVLEDEHTSKTAGYYTTVVVLIFAFAALVFILYDCLVERRQAKVLTRARNVSKIISSLYPSNVRDRLIKEEEQKENMRRRSTIQKRNSEVLKRGSGVIRNDSAGRASFVNRPSALKRGSTLLRSRRRGLKLERQTSLEDLFDCDGSRHSDVDIDNDLTSEPIADLFPNTTIMFADLVGFTAWSSEREPSQVFRLLETIYSSFDQIAKRRRVFKVETVGDCYVAVTGLPVPRKDHAVVMARFARECMSKMDVVVKKLETTLGPDTADLCMRVGLHSGPVTAGVLRGEKSRFQLFGDTMNTASRMESKGKPRHIQVSQATADLLIEAGKEHWVTPREEKIVAKGKGELQTYWVSLTPNKKSSKASNESDDEEYASAKDDDAEDDFPIINAAAGKTSDRLGGIVEWNVDVLRKLLEQILAHRRATKHSLGTVAGSSRSFTPEDSSRSFVPGTLASDSSRSFAPGSFASGSSRSFAAGSSPELLSPRPQQGSALIEVRESITFPEPSRHDLEQNSDSKLELPAEVQEQLEKYVKTIASLYHSHPFHNFEHASHVAMCVSKLMSRVVAPDQSKTGASKVVAMLTSDPLTQFSCFFSALVHDVDHPGVPNTQLVAENTEMAKEYRNNSVAEQNSIEQAWNILMEDSFCNLRDAIWSNESEKRLFRQIIVHSVIATDVADKGLQTLRKIHWENTFNPKAGSIIDTIGRDAVNRKATLVIELLIQVSDVSYAMQHWESYIKWSERLYQEIYDSFLQGRAQQDPADYWFEHELQFFDTCVIPLAKKLKDCGCFGVSGDEYLGYAEMNRKEWVSHGQEFVADLIKKRTPARDSESGAESNSE